MVLDEDMSSEQLCCHCLCLLSSSRNNFFLKEQGVSNNPRGAQQDYAFHRLRLGLVLMLAIHIFRTCSGTHSWLRRRPGQTTNATKENQSLAKPADPSAWPWTTPQECWESSKPMTPPKPSFLDQTTTTCPRATSWRASLLKIMMLLAAAPAPIASPSPPPGLLYSSAPAGPCYITPLPPPSSAHAISPLSPLVHSCHHHHCCRRSIRPQLLSLFAHAVVELSNFHA